MDVLKKKSYPDYTHTSRYNTIPYYYHSLDEKYIYGVAKNLNKENTYIVHKVTPTDTLDSLALLYYNNPTYYWVIASFNNIQDVFDNLIDHYKVLKIPQIATISFGDER